MERKMSNQGFQFFGFPERIPNNPSIGARMLAVFMLIASPTIFCSSHTHWVFKVLYVVGFLFCFIQSIDVSEVTTKFGVRYKCCNCGKEYIQEDMTYAVFSCEEEFDRYMQKHWGAIQDNAMRRHNKVCKAKRTTHAHAR
jgi:hypothetical protein